MRIVVLGGAGIIGRQIARDLSRAAEKLVIADVDREGAAQLAEELGEVAIARQVDVTNANELEMLLAGADACVNSVNYYFNLTVMQACLATGVSYLDLGGLFHTTRKQLELDNEFRRRGVTAVLGIGSCPGVANVQAGWLGAMLDSIDAVRIYNGATPNTSDALAAPYAIQTILDEVRLPAVVYHRGQFEERPPLSDEEHYHFPEPIGTLKTHLSLHSEVATIPVSFAEKGIQECSFKISFFGYSEAALRKIQFLVELGLASTEPMEVAGMELRPRDLLLKLLEQLPQPERETPPQGYKAVVTEITGRIADSAVTLTAETVGGPRPGNAVSAGRRLVAGPAAIVGKWLAEGRLSRPGVWAPEQVIEPEPFFAELAQRGFETQLVRREPITYSPAADTEE